MLFLWHLNYTQSHMLWACLFHLFLICTISCHRLLLKFYFTKERLNFQNLSYFVCLLVTTGIYNFSYLGGTIWLLWVQWQRGRWFSGAIPRGPAVFLDFGGPRPFVMIFFVSLTKHKHFCKFIITRVILLLKEIFYFKNTPFYFNTFT